MDTNKLTTQISKIIKDIESLIPQYTSNPLDDGAEGNVAVCFIDEKGMVYGHIWGDDKLRGRQYFNNAWKKASQVWITGICTYEFEKKLFSGEFTEEKYGIPAPELIGWEGGQPMMLSDGTILFVGFSGFRGINDVDIIKKVFNDK